MESEDGRVLTDAGSLFVRKILSNTALEIIETSDFKRLAEVSQANARFSDRSRSQTHTRYLHSIQIAVIANWLAKSLSLPENISKTLEVIMLLHDCAHPPFNHVGEDICKSLGKTYDHDKKARKIITSGKINKILIKAKIDPEIVASVIEESGKYPNIELLKNILDRTYLHDDVISSPDSYHKNYDAIKIIDKMLGSIRYSTKSKLPPKSLIEFEKQGKVIINPKAMSDFMELRRKSFYETTYHPASLLVKHLLISGIHKAGYSAKKFLKSSEEQILDSLDPGYNEILKKGVDNFFTFIDIPLSEFSNSKIDHVLNSKFINKLLKSVGLSKKIQKTKIRKKDFAIVVTPDYSKKIEILTYDKTKKKFIPITITSPVPLTNRYFSICLNNEVPTEIKKTIVKRVLIFLYATESIDVPSKYKL